MLHRQSNLGFLVQNVSGGGGGEWTGKELIPDSDVTNGMNTDGTFQGDKEEQKRKKTDIKE